MPEFRRDLYKGAAEYYERFRPSYPRDLFADLLERTRTAPRRRLLDLACGTGQIAFALHRHFDETWAVDQEQEMIELGRRNAERLGLTSIRWVVAPAETLAAPPGLFDLVAIGNAFHRLRRADVARKLFEWITPGSHVALLWSYGPSDGNDEWQLVVAGVVREWTERLGATDRVPSDLEQALLEEPHEAVLADAGFEVIGKFEFPTLITWTPDTLAGFVYSTSVLSRPVFGDRAPEFERDLRDRLLRVEPSGVFRQVNVFAHQLARRPAG